MSHIPVLLNEMLASLSPVNGETYVDATFGGGGYSQAVLRSADCQVIAFDRDPDAVERGQKLKKQFPSRFQIMQGTFSQMQGLLNNLGVLSVEGFVFDLGVSSYQLDTPERGFSFRFDAPLDMRMSNTGITAAEIVNTCSQEELANIIFRFGEEKRSRTIARHIVAARAQEPLQTTTQLASLIKSVIKDAKPGHHPATKTFQALRMFVNNELAEIEEGLKIAEACLEEGGRLVVVTFHSLEDRLVKQFLKTRSSESQQESRHLPHEPSASRLKKSLSFKKIKGTGVKGIKAGAGEIMENPRARSARLRAAVRLAAFPASPSSAE